MGYYTYYQLETIPDNQDVKDLIKNKYQEIYNNSLSEGKGRCKWYGHEEDMLELSKLFPTTLFKLHGKGEEHVDIWDKYFLNGKIQTQRAVIIIPPMSETEWKSEEEWKNG